MNFGDRYLHVADHYVRDYERLLTGGVWAQVDMRFEYDEETKGKHPFWIDQARRRSRLPHSTSMSTGPAGSEFTTDEWIDFVRPKHGLRARRRWTAGSSCCSSCG